MVVFPNAKINLGLHVTAKRSDGFHTLETVFYPVSWKDALEVVEGSSPEPFQLHLSGLAVQGPLETNLIYKAWQLIREDRALPPLEVFLHKAIPMGAGLGGGSADAAFFINALNTHFDLNLSLELRQAHARQLGSDCAFFIENTPVYAAGKGDELEPFSIDLNDYHLVLVYPGIHSNTKDAYCGIQPQAPAKPLKEILSTEPVSRWKEVLVNDFEQTIFRKYPAIRELKESLYRQGAIYACMSGSGSAVFGLFEKEPVLDLPKEYTVMVQKKAGS